MRTAPLVLALLFLTCGIYADDNNSFGTWDAADRAGNDLPGMPVDSIIPENCQSKCFSNPQCRSWAFDTCKKQCWLKSSDGPQNPNGCIRSGRIFADRNVVFANPITDGFGADPWMIKIGDWYYLTYTTGGDVRLWRNRNIMDWQNAESKQVWYPNGPSAGLGGIWAPELHLINGRLYIYVSAETGGDSANHRMYVLQGRSGDPFGDWDFVGKLSTPDDNWAIDGTVWQNHGRLYFIWSGWENRNPRGNQNLYIALMASPTQLAGNRVRIMNPSADWQFDGRGGVGINEGPQVLQNGNRTFIIYSAASSWTSRYCLGMMGTEGGDPMNPNSWWRYNDKPVMSSSNNVWGPGHCSFTYDNNNTPWIVYHATDVKKDTDGWATRTIRAEPFRWNADGSPWLPSPPRNTGQVVPRW